MLVTELEEDSDLYISMGKMPSTANILYLHVQKITVLIDNWTFLRKILSFQTTANIASTYREVFCRGIGSRTVDIKY